MAQSTICADTGNGATITFAGMAALDSYKIRRIDQSEQSVGQIECSDLDTTGERKFIPEDLTDPIEVDIEWIFDTFQDPPSPGDSLGLVTITYPLRDGETTAATRAGTAFVKAIKHPTLANNELQLGTMKIQFDGSATPVTFTKST